MASGSVIHGAGGEQDMRFMGGLREKMRWTYVTMVIGSLALAGIPIFAGFFSKDEILGEAFTRGYGVYWAVGIGGRLHDRLLHVPDDLHDLPRVVARAGRGVEARPRERADHGRPARDPGRADRPGRPPAGHPARWRRHPHLAGGGLPRRRGAGSRDPARIDRRRGPRQRRAAHLRAVRARRPAPADRSERSGLAGIYVALPLVRPRSGGAGPIRGARPLRAWARACIGPA